MLLLTGATGFLGDEIVRALLAKKIRVRCLARKKEDAERLRKNCAVAMGDITGEQAVANAAKGCDVIIHGAAIIRGTKEEYERTNIQGTRNIVEAARKAKAKHIIFLSTILAAYEKTTSYGKSKLAGEEIIKNSGVPHTILRLSIAYKEGDNKTIGKLIALVKKLPVVPVIAGRSEKLQPVYAKDVAKAIASAASRKPRNKTYYLAGPVITFEELMKTMAAALAVKRMFLPMPKPIMKMAVAVYSTLTLHKSFTNEQLDFILAGKAFEYEDATKDLGFSPISFNEGARKAATK